MADLSVSDDDRQRMRRLARSLAAAESDEPVDGAALAAAVSAANRARSTQGVVPLLEGSAEPPEEELYRRARALGLR